MGYFKLHILIKSKSFKERDVQAHPNCLGVTPELDTRLQSSKWCWG